MIELKRKTFQTNHKELCMSTLAQLYYHLLLLLSSSPENGNFFQLNQFYLETIMLNYFILKNQRG